MLNPVHFSTPEINTVMRSEEYTLIGVLLFVHWSTHNRYQDRYFDVIHWPTWKVVKVLIVYLTPFNYHGFYC